MLFIYLKFFDFCAWISAIFFRFFIPYFFSDLIGDDINSMFPSLHIILQYTFLYIDQDNHLLHVLATILRQIMAIFINGMTKDNQESYEN
jgi:hypothetical protein